MKKIILFIGLIIIWTIITFTSCERKGCADVNATNYCEKCNKDDGSCTYKSQLVFWWKKPFADSCAAHGIVKAGITVDCIVLGNITLTGQSWTANPGCGASSTMTVNKDLGLSKTVCVPVHYDVVFSGGTSSPLGDISHDAAGDFTKTINGGQCNDFELIW